MEYLPFGEILVDEHLNSRNSPFKYNGKEFDEETGNYYYGARYYDPKWSIWVSVDPMVERTKDAYGYCYNNPINLVDPDGNFPKLYDDINYQSNDEPPINFFRPTKLQPIKLASMQFLQKQTKRIIIKMVTQFLRFMGMVDLKILVTTKVLIKILCLPLRHLTIQ